MSGDDSPLGASGHCVLVVDGDDAMRRLFRIALADFGCAVYEARDGPEALEVLRDRPMCVVIVDIPGQGSSCWSVLKALRGRRTGAQPATIAIASDHAALAVATEIGVDATLLKPFSLRWLRAAIDHLAAQEEPRHAPTAPFHLPLAGSRFRRAAGASSEPFSHHTMRAQHHG